MGSIQRAIVGVGRINEFVKHLRQGLQTAKLAGEPSLKVEFLSLEVRVEEFFLSHSQKRGERRPLPLKDIQFSGKAGRIDWNRWPIRLGKIHSC